MTTRLPAISVLMACYNQVEFITAAIEGILIQETGALLEVVVADDASTDGTRELAVRLLPQRPGLEVRFLPSDINLGATENYFRGFLACRAPLVALLDGDDYWTRPDKLAVQSAFLTMHPHYSCCATNYQMLDMATGLLAPRVEVDGTISSHTAHDLILENIPGNLSACMYRRSALVSLAEELRGARCGDWLINICVARDGPLGFLHESMSVYRRGNGGMWSSLSLADQFRLLLDLIPEYDRLTNGTFGETFARAAAGFRGELARLTGQPVPSVPA